MPHAHDPRPENGEAILAFARDILPKANWRPLGELRVEYDRGYWRVKDVYGNSWRVLPFDGCPDAVIFEVESLA